MKQILYFSAAWCGPCKQLSPTIRKLMSEGINIKKIDVDSNPQMVAQYGIRNVPTLVFENQGQIKTKKTGMLSESQIKDTWNQL